MRSALNLDLGYPNQILGQYTNDLKRLLSHGIQVLEMGETDAIAEPWDIVCLKGQRDRVLEQWVQFKTLGLGTTYIKGLWECERIDYLSRCLFELDLEARTNPILFEMPNSIWLVVEQLLYQFFNVSLIRQHDAQKHYDLPTELYEGFLGASMKYTTGDWSGLDPLPENLDVAQRQNLDYWAEELQIQSGDVILDCGCGWGTLPQYLLEHDLGQNLTYIGITISEVQVDYCRKHFQKQPNFFFYNHSYHDSYREILAKSGVVQITKCIFLETIEHGGIRNWPNILKQVRRVMVQSGILGIQTIGSDHPSPVSDPYINRYIFPHGSIGSPSELGRAIEANRQFVEYKRRNIVADYVLTLRAWNHFFQKNWSSIEPHIDCMIQSTPFSNSQEWKRHWEFYLLLCCGIFEAGTYAQVYQLTAKPNFFVN
ncbi:MAG: methyltransferase domain-containing protein [Synechococcales cyanobacterium CRU_2_2]|nr:methyltransferase domain-containing protein [Synechococcales cyanobacterium CRU_2_2]